MVTPLLMRTGTSHRHTRTQPCSHGDLILELFMNSALIMKNTSMTWTVRQVCGDETRINTSCVSAFLRSISGMQNSKRELTRETLPLTSTYGTCMISIL